MTVIHRGTLDIETDLSADRHMRSVRSASLGAGQDLSDDRHMAWAHSAMQLSSPQQTSDTAVTWLGCTVTRITAYLSRPQLQQLHGLGTRLYSIQLTSANLSHSSCMAWVHGDTQYSSSQQTSVAAVARLGYTAILNTAHLSRPQLQQLHVLGAQ